MASIDLNDFSTNMTAGERTFGERKLRIGIIGMGGIAQSHLKSYVKQPDVTIVAACDLIEGKSEKLLSRFELTDVPCFTDYRKMIDTVKMDAVSVCTYNRTHAECTIYALEHGINVLLEKPMTVTLEEAVAIRKAEKKSGKIVSVGFQPRFDANMQMIKKIVQSGELGRVFYVQTGGGRRHGIPVSWSETFIEGDKAGLGALGDIGCYSIDLVMNALGNPKPLRVTGVATDFFGKTPEAYAGVGKPECAKKFSVDDFASAYIRLEGGIVLDFRISWYMHLDTTGDTIIMGTKGSLRIPSTECWNGTFHKPMTIYHDIAGKPVQTEIPLIESPAEPTLFDKKIRSFLDAVIDGKPAPVPTDQIIYNQAILDGINRSSKLGREVEIEIPEI
ncbi:MAG: Gfo/Idh/MocA family oxidoreductase [Lachnospiraceae bacterium]|nr:Gfo/Idh/MocA family oxidoreductase [Lachnospiraceae bacterium]